MSDTLSPPAETGALVVVERSAISTIVSADKDDILGKLAAEIAAHDPDISTKKGRAAIASLAAKVASSKMDLIRLGKGLTEGWRKQTAAVNAECKIIEERMDALKKQVRQPLDEIEAAEAARERANLDALAALEALTDGLTDLTAAEIKARYDSIQPFDWAIEFKPRAERVKTGVVAQLQVAHQAARQREAEAVAAAIRAAEEAERQRLAAIEVQRQREAQIAAEAAERAKREAEDAAAAQAKAAAEAVERERHEAEQRAEAERQAAARRESEAREAQERAEARARQAEADRLEAIERAERDRVEAARKAETDRIAAAQAAERDRLAAIEAERRRVAQEKTAAEAAAAQRAANVAHKRRINGEALADLLKAMEAIPEMSLHDGTDLGTPTAKAIVAAIARGEVRHISISY